MTQRTHSRVTIVLIIGAKVLGSGGPLGELTRVVVEPTARAVTHLVVEPQRPPGAGHLVPVELVASASEDEIKLRCSATDFASFDMAREVHFIRGGNGPRQPSQIPSVPYSLAAINTSAGNCNPEGLGSGPHPVITERIPSGDIDLRRGECVHATDGTIGLVLGLVVDPRDHAVTHILLHEGHLRGEKRVAIPIGAVTGVENGVRLSLSKHEVEILPEICVDDPY
jgi:sporulation protein YlmC with PRC-barrel domain